jgi:hypothetical protein
MSLTWEKLLTAAKEDSGKQNKRWARRKIRYYCYILQRAATGEADNVSIVPAGLKEFYEGRAGFTEWGTFAVKWDLRGDPEEDREGSPFDIIPRRRSVHQEWNSQVRREARPLPTNIADT